MCHVPLNALRKLSDGLEMIVTVNNVVAKQLQYQVEQPSCR